MLATLFYFILNMSIAAVLVIGVLLIIRLIKPLPRRVIYLLWSLAFFRLIMPFTLATHWSLFNFTGRMVKKLISIETFTQGADGLPQYDGIQAMNMIGAADSYGPVIYKTEALHRFFITAAVIWASVAIVLFLLTVVFYLLNKSELKKAVHIRADLYRSPLVFSPVVDGVLSAKIILPPTLDPNSEEGEMILAHERVHIKRSDNLWRLLGIWTVCLHWFNPLAWIMLKSFLTDMELSCDELVIRKYAEDKRKTYAATLLRYAENNRSLATAAFGQSGVRGRIVNVLNYRKLTLLGALISSLFLVIVVVVLITNPTLRG